MTEIQLDSIYTPSEDVVAREIMDELIIVPLVAGIGDLESELFTLNDTGRAIWSHLNGERNLQEIIELLAQDYDAPQDDIEQDVLGLVQELARLRIVIEVTED